MDYELVLLRAIYSKLPFFHPFIVASDGMQQQQLQAPPTGDYAAQATKGESQSELVG